MISSDEEDCYVPGRVGGSPVLSKSSDSHQCVDVSDPKPAESRLVVLSLVKAPEVVEQVSVVDHREEPKPVVAVGVKPTPKKLAIKGYWFKHGEDWTVDTASRHPVDKTRAVSWPSQRPAEWPEVPGHEGNSELIGCGCCHNFVLHLQKTNSKTKGTKWSRFEVVPLSKGQLQNHADKCAMHQKAVAFHFRVDLLEMPELQLTPAGGVLPAGSPTTVCEKWRGWGPRVPYPKHYLRTWVSSQRFSSTPSHVDHALLDDPDSTALATKHEKQKWTMAEVQR